jgi:ComF family protein
MISFLDSLYQTFFPKVCYGCDTDLSATESWLCSKCRADLPLTNYHRYQDNPIARLFWGRVHLDYACAYLLFVKDGTVQHLLHGLKYQHAPKIGIALGEWYGLQLKADDAFKEIDMILPVPLHLNKQQKRGYNQSEMFALGLSNSLNKPVNNLALKRKVATDTQTRKSRIERWLNVEEVFEVEVPERIEGKRILLVDDVITTGATLEACSRQLLQVKDVSVSVAAIAFAKV